jgi:glycopeptide antibiotics resistance protein
VTGRSRWTAGLLLLACLAGVLLLAFAPIASSLDRLSLKLYAFFGVHHSLAPAWVTPEDYGRLLNVVFFVPVGLTLAWWLGARWGWAMPLAVCLSLAIEVAQRLPEVGRDSTLDDVACNVIGASLGVVVVAVLRSASASASAPVDPSG